MSTHIDSANKIAPCCSRSQEELQLQYQMAIQLLEGYNAEEQCEYLKEVASVGVFVEDLRIDSDDAEPQLRFPDVLPQNAHCLAFVQRVSTQKETGRKVVVFDLCGCLVKEHPKFHEEAVSMYQRSQVEKLQVIEKEKELEENIGREIGALKKLQLDAQQKVLNDRKSLTVLAEAEALKCEELIQQNQHRNVTHFNEMQQSCQDRCSVALTDQSLRVANIEKDSVHKLSIIEARIMKMLEKEKERIAANQNKRVNGGSNRRAGC